MTNSGAPVIHTISGATLFVGGNLDVSKNGANNTTLDLASNPPVRVFEGNELLGHTPVVLELPAGMHELAVDLDATAFASRSLEGQRPGDQPYRLWRTNDALIVGWERVYAVSIATAESRLLGEATIWERRNVSAILECVIGGSNSTA